MVGSNSVDHHSAMVARKLQHLEHVVVMSSQFLNSFRSDSALVQSAFTQFARHFRNMILPVSLPGHFITIYVNSEIFDQTQITIFDSIPKDVSYYEQLTNTIKTAFGLPRDSTRIHATFAGFQSNGVDCGIHTMACTRALAETILDPNLSNLVYDGQTLRTAFPDFVRYDLNVQWEKFHINLVREWLTYQIVMDRLTPFTQTIDWLAPLLRDQ